MKVRRKAAPPPATKRGATTLAIGIVVACLIAVRANTMAHSRPPAVIPPALHPITGPAPVDVNAAANSLVRTVKASASDDDSLPPFARERLQWLTARQRAGELSIVLLDDPESAHLDHDALMASGDADGRQVIAISRSRLARFLIEEGSTSAPFSRRQHIDFLLGLVHETVHLERPHTGRRLSLDERLDEEMRTWRAVDLHVVRPLLERREPMNQRFIDADDAIRSCGDKEPCQALKELLLPSERLRY